MNRFEKRIEALRAKFDELGIDGLYIRSPYNVRYFTGKKGNDCYLWITKTRANIITDHRCFEIVSSIEWLTPLMTDYEKSLYDYIAECPYTKVGFEAEYVNYSEYQLMQKKLAGKELIPTKQVVEELRAVKDEEEIELMKAASLLGCESFNYILGVIKEGMTEKQIAFELETDMRRRGAEGLSFESIVASGPNGSMPHAIASDRKVQRGDLITMDFGCLLNGYCSDMTRTVALGYVKDDEKKAYDAVLEAQLYVHKHAKAGMLGKDIHNMAVDVIASRGLEPFPHGLGHGCGLEVHENPRLSPKGEIAIKPNVITSNEPGYYLTGKFGLRIEDLVLFTPEGLVNLCPTAPKELIVL